jgi:hypothetical protein
VILDNQESTFP